MPLRLQKNLIIETNLRQSHRLYLTSIMENITLFSELELIDSLHYSLVLFKLYYIILRKCGIKAISTCL